IQQVDPVESAVGSGEGDEGPVRGWIAPGGPIDEIDELANVRAVRVGDHQAHPEATGGVGVAEESEPCAVAPESRCEVSGCAADEKVRRPIDRVEGKDV